MVHSQASSCWSTGLTANSLSRQYASFGRIDLPMSAAHSFGSNTCARPHPHPCFATSCSMPSRTLLNGMLPACLALCDDVLRQLLSRAERQGLRALSAQYTLALPECCRDSAKTAAREPALHVRQHKDNELLVRQLQAGSSSIMGPVRLQHGAASMGARASPCARATAAPARSRPGGATSAARW